MQKNNNKKAKSRGKSNKLWIMPFVKGKKGKRMMRGGATRIDEFDAIVSDIMSANIGKEALDNLKAVLTEFINLCDTKGDILRMYSQSIFLRLASATEFMRTKLDAQQKKVCMHIVETILADLSGQQPLSLERKCIDRPFKDIIFACLLRKPPNKTLSPFRYFVQHRIHVSKAKLETDQNIKSIPLYHAVYALMQALKNETDSTIHSDIDTLVYGLRASLARALPTLSEEHRDLVLDQAKTVYYIVQLINSPANNPIDLNIQQSLRDMDAAHRDLYHLKSNHKNIYTFVKQTCNYMLDDEVGPLVAKYVSILFKLNQDDWKEIKERYAKTEEEQFKKELAGALKNVTACTITSMRMAPNNKLAAIRHLNDLRQELSQSPTWNTFFMLYDKWKKKHGSDDETLRETYRMLRPVLEAFMDVESGVIFNPMDENMSLTLFQTLGQLASLVHNIDATRGDDDIKLYDIFVKYVEALADEIKSRIEVVSLTDVNVYLAACDHEGKIIIDEKSKDKDEVHIWHGRTDIGKEGEIPVYNQDVGALEFRGSRIQYKEQHRDLEITRDLFYKLYYKDDKLLIQFSALHAVEPDEVSIYLNNFPIQHLYSENTGSTGDFYEITNGDILYIPSAINAPSTYYTLKVSPPPSVMVSRFCGAPLRADQWDEIPKESSSSAWWNIVGEKVGVQTVELSFITSDDKTLKKDMKVFFRPTGSSAGGKAKAAGKVHVLGRERTIIVEGRKKKIRYQGKLITLKEAKELQRKLKK